MNKLKTHIISHTHWDREWFLPATYTSPWLVPFFDKLFHLLDVYPQYRFVLDGQVQMVEDYLSELDPTEREEKEEILRKYIGEGRLFIGPYWAQIDWQIPGAESIVRNLLLAREYTKRYGGRMDVGWLPDTFGQIGQAPQIHRLSGVDGVFVWRGVEFPNDDVHSEFLWESPDGSRVISVYFLASYRNLMGLTTYPEIADDRLKNEVEKVRPFAETENVFLMNGYDLDNSPEYPLGVISEEKFPQYEIFQSDPKRYVEEIKKDDPDLVCLKGELLSGRYLSVFPGKLSTRSYLKVENHTCEYLISRLVEPLGVFSWLFSGFYPQDEINSLWRELIINEIHDNISGVGVDQIHKRMEESYALIMKKGKDVLKHLISHILPFLRGGRWVVFNTNPFKVSTTLEVGEKVYSVDEIPALGFKVLEDLPSHTLISEKRRIDEFLWENRYYTASLSDSGTLTLYDKRSKKIYKDVGFFIDEGDEGDEYNFSPSHPEKTVSTKGKRADLLLIHKTDISSVVEVKRGIVTPDRGKILITYTVTFDDTPLVKYKIKIENDARDHRLKMVFPTPMKDAQIVAHMPFEYVVRQRYIDNSKPIPPKFSRIFIGARENTIDYEFPMGEFVALSDNEGLFAVLPSGLKEYEVHGDTIHITLLRSVGWISNGEIKTRTGDAGPLMYTPSAQSLGEFNVELSLYAGPGTPFDKEFRYWKGIYHNPPILVLRDNGPREGIGGYSLFETEDLEVTGVKVSEERDGVIVRGFNPDREKEITISFGEKGIEAVNLLEESIGPLEDSVKVGPSQIVTLKLKREGGKREEVSQDFSILYPLLNWDIYRQRDEDIKEEKELRLLRDMKERLKNEISQLRERLSQEKGIEYHKVFFEILSKERTYLEVTLSLLLNEEIDLPEGKEKEDIRKRIQDVGLKLNDARIKRRAYEYVLDYYLHKR